MNKLGVAAESAAEAYLLSQGLRIIARNWQCRRGELDLIAFDGATLVFVEVRQRRASSHFGGAAASISAAKRAKLLAAAQIYLQTLSVIPPCRFDAICFDGVKMEWLKNCIDASY